MGSSMAPIPINYLLTLFNDLESSGNFMYRQSAYLSQFSLDPGNSI